MARTRLDDRHDEQRAVEARANERVHRKRARQSVASVEQHDEERTYRRVDQPAQRRFARAQLALDRARAKCTEAIVRKAPRIMRSSRKKDASCKR